MDFRTDIGYTNLCAQIYLRKNRFINICISTFYHFIDKKKQKNCHISKNILTFASAFGSVAQLNRASDYGSEGYRFESCRSHKHKTLDESQAFLFYKAVTESLLSTSQPYKTKTGGRRPPVLCLGKKLMRQGYRSVATKSWK